MSEGNSDSSSGEDVAINIFKKKMLKRKLDRTKDISKDSRECEDIQAETKIPRKPKVSKLQKKLKAVDSDRTELKKVKKAAGFKQPDERAKSQPTLEINEDKIKKKRRRIDIAVGNIDNEVSDSKEQQDRLEMFEFENDYHRDHIKKSVEKHDEKIKLDKTLESRKKKKQLKAYKEITAENLNSVIPKRKKQKIFQDGGEVGSEKEVARRDRLKIKTGDTVVKEKKKSLVSLTTDRDSGSDTEDKSGSEAESDDGGIEEQVEEEVDEYAVIKKELSNMSFEEVQQLKETLGTKIFNQVVHGDRDRDRPSGSQRKKVFKRENKNRPLEMTSKKPVSRFREAVSVKKKILRDPRFDDLSGTYKEDFFRTAYSFLDDVKAKEKEKLKKVMKKTSNATKKSEITFLLNRMNQQDQIKSQKDKSANIQRAWKKKEQELVKQGKKPFFLKKSDRKTLELAEKYKELQKSGGLEKYLSKKRKKSAQKERKKLPAM